MSFNIFIAEMIIIISIGLLLYFNGYSGLRKKPKIKEKQIKVACVGDSITYGFGIGNWPKNNYPKQLQKLLGKDYIVANFGVSGSCVGTFADLPYKRTKVYFNSLEYNPDILIFMLGSNDSKYQNWTSKEQFKEEYLMLLNSYKKEENLKIYLCTIAKAFFKEDNSIFTNYKIQPDMVDKIVGIIKEIAYENSYDLIDINELTKHNYQWFTDDNVHPNKDGALAIAKEVYHHIKTSK